MSKRQRERTHKRRQEWNQDHRGARKAAEESQERLVEAAKGLSAMGFVVAPQTVYVPD